MEQVNQDAGGEIALANWILEEACVPATNSTRLLVAQCIRLLAKEGGDLKTAADYILLGVKAGQREGERINRFFFEDQKYRPQVPRGPAARPLPPGEAEARHKAAEQQEQEAYAVWQSMSEGYRAENPWRGGT